MWKHLNAKLIYIYAFSRRFYPKPECVFLISMCDAMTFWAANALSHGNTNLWIRTPHLWFTGEISRLGFYHFVHNIQHLLVSTACPCSFNTVHFLKCIYIFIWLIVKASACFHGNPTNDAVQHYQRHYHHPFTTNMPLVFQIVWDTSNPVTQSRGICMHLLGDDQFMGRKFQVVGFIWIYSPFM